MPSRRKGPAFGAVGFGAVALGAAVLVLLGPPRDRSVPRPRPSPASPSVSGGGFTLTAARIDLPNDDLSFPAGPHLEAVQANCTSCHSPAMILSQPPLPRAVWQAEVEKMQKVYHAPVDPAAVPGIVDYLSALSPQPRP